MSMQIAEHAIISDNFKRKGRMLECTRRFMAAAFAEIRSRVQNAIQFFFLQCAAVLLQLMQSRIALLKEKRGSDFIRDYLNHN